MPKRLWNRKELIIAMNLYCKLSFGQFHRNNSTIIKVAKKLDRSSSALAMKLCNLAAIDPVHKNRGIKGLKGYSKLDKSIWDEFHNNWEEMIFESEKELAKLFNSDDNINDKIEITDEKLILPLEKTEKETIVKVRKGQSFFRKTVLSSYNNCCCITGNPVSELLVASHIIPWAKSPENRLNPKNGLCLARTHDSAFDQGLISFDQDYKLMISPYLESFLPNKTLETNFFIYKNQQINLPNKFKPDEQFLSFHRENIFRH